MKGSIRGARSIRRLQQGEELDTYINNVLDPNKRVDTDLKELWRQQ